MDALDPAAWCERCAMRIAALDEQIADADARKLARDVYGFERTRAMEPEAAADFIASEMGRSDRTRFERRSAAR